MDISERNRRVAIARWNKYHSKQKDNIPSDRNSLLLKAAVCGFLAGDGSVQKRREKNFYHHQIDFFPDDIVMKDNYIKQIITLYNKNPTIRKNNKFFSVRFTSKVAFDDLTKIAGFGIKKWTLPESLFKIKGAKENWLKAFFSAEAYIGNNSIKIQTVNKKGMKDISKLLINLDIDNHYYEYNPKKKNTSSVGIVIIYKKESRKKFLDNIGFWHDKKTKILKESLSL